MSAKKYGKGRANNAGGSFRLNEKSGDGPGPPVELENQFILRLPGRETYICYQITYFYFVQRNQLEL